MTDKAAPKAAAAARAMILPLALAQFIASYAATNMNVAISAIATDGEVLHGLLEYGHLSSRDQRRTYCGGLVTGSGGSGIEIGSRPGHAGGPAPGTGSASTS